MLLPTIPFRASRFLVVALLAGACCSCSRAQDTLIARDLGIFFPAPMAHSNWRASFGFITFTTPEDITEEVRVRVPALDVHVLRHVYKGFYLDGRLLFQLVQNQLSVGARWATPLSDKFYFSLGDDVAYWRGNLPVQGFATQGSGWENYPSISFGFRSRRDLLFTLKAEMLVSTDRAVIIDREAMDFNIDHVTGSAYSLYMEQPFFKKSRITLGFTLAYANFLWPTWALFSTFDRNLLYPQITVGLIP